MKYYKGPCEVVGRPSPLGNPYSHKDKSIAKFKTKNVDESIEKYRIWLYSNLDNDCVVQELYRLLNILHSRDLILGCWCVPFTNCHAQVIKELLEKLR